MFKKRRSTTDCIFIFKLFSWRILVICSLNVAWVHEDLYCKNARRLNKDKSELIPNYLCFAAQYIKGKNVGTPGTSITYTGNRDTICCKTFSAFEETLVTLLFIRIISSTNINQVNACPDSRVLGDVISEEFQAVSFATFYDNLMAKSHVR